MENPSQGRNGSVQDDVLSVTSTIEETHNSDEEFTVERILADRLIEGRVLYLVQWEGYELSSATWEPEDCFKPGTISDWEDFKRKTGRSTALGFTVRRWKDSVECTIKRKRARHDARNRKRAALGESTTEFSSLFEEYLNALQIGLEGEEDPDSEGDSAGKETRKDNEDAQREDEDSDDEMTVLETLRSAGHIRPQTNSGEEQSNIEAGPNATAQNPQPVSRKRRQSDSIISPTAAAHVPEQGGKMSVLKNAPYQVRRRMSTSTTKGAISRQAIISTPKQRDVASVRSGIAASSNRIESSAAKAGAISSNVFLGGKTRKKRSTLLDAVSDSTKDPKFLRLRHQRLVEKQLRDGEGTRAPRRPSGEVFSLAGHTQQVLGPQPSASELISEMDITSSTMGMNSSQTLRETTGGSKRDRKTHTQDGDEAITDSTENVKKQRRSVHFSDVPEVRDATDSEKSEIIVAGPALDDMAIDDDQPAATPPTEAASGSRQPATQSVCKECQFGSGAAQALQLGFAGVPVHENIPWIEQFKSQNRIVFSHSCTAQNFALRTDLWEEQLCRGHVSEAGAAVRSIAERLRVGSLGLLCYGGRYCVLVFPSDSEDWNRGAEVDASTASTDSALSYIIFKPRPILDASTLAPIAYTAARPEPSAKSDPAHVPVFDMVFGPTYYQLLPSESLNSKKHKFFIAFPHCALEEALLVSQWLRGSATSSDAECVILTSLQPGHWLNFAKVDSGTVIVHEDAVWAIRLFPNLADLLHKSSRVFSFWIFRRALVLEHPLPCLEPSPLGARNTELCRVFSHGTAILVTPSFFVAQPAQAYNFVKWWYQNYSPKSKTLRSGSLVVCAGIADWIRDLALEKTQRYHDKPKDRTTEGLTLAAIESLFKSWALMRQFMTELDDETDGSSLVFAPEDIDDDDEQSLVNWFGWWTISHMHQVRKLYILGSGKQHHARLTRLLQPPHFRPLVSREPDARARRPSKTQETLQLVLSDEGTAIADYTTGLNDSIKQMSACPLIFYMYPISYWNPDMAFHFGDYNSTFSSFRAWLHFFPDYIDDRTTRGHKKARAPWINTCAGLFYTIEEEWDPSRFPKNAKPNRRPWAAMLRPTNPHIKPWKGIELFIWDYAAREQQAEGEPLYASDLIEAQHRLVKLVQEQSGEQLRLPLDRVWLGGFVPGQARGDFSHPLDVTLDYLTKLPQMIRSWLPAPQQMLPDKGWMPVKLEKRPQPGSPHQSATPEVVDTVKTEVAAQETRPAAMKTVFEPPLAIGLRSRDYSSSNRLYEWAAAQRRNGVRGKSEYRFRPTMEWYHDQVLEGRGFHHITVTDWKTIFERFHIHNPK
ncbi:hypothetical protein DCS_06187 [Drechmeria coniospora]|uniref:Chromo domain-containing protein n=1 Tax=Drechmeria coniospora TaxID=98403 RepID=A0A151GAV9_DRECN|nr:hypothetical protein DCS_06187 [Drechmeria coniospora]KYK54230.1 hypothetical protein DCS_06187 [Drechmeria coniospora]